MARVVLAQAGCPTAVQDGDGDGVEGDEARTDDHDRRRPGCSRGASVVGPTPARYRRHHGIRAFAPPPPRRPARPAPEVRGNVWIVDDSPAQLAQAVALLQLHHVVRPFSSGEALLERLSNEPLPDVIVLDWQMPGLAGIDVCRFIRLEHDEVTLPILMLTTRGAQADLDESFAAGVNDYVSKPWVAAALLARVATLVRVRRQAELLRRRAAAFDVPAASGAAIVTDSAGVITAFNAGAEALTGLRREEVEGQSVTEALRLVRANDVSQRLEVEAELRSEREQLVERDVQLGLALRGGRMGTWSIDLANNVLTGDASFRKLRGVADGVDLDQAIDARAHVDDRPAIRAALTRSIEQSVPYVCEYRWGSAREGWRWISARGEPRRDASGRTYGLAGVAFDIDDQKRAASAVDLLLDAFGAQPLFGFVLLRGAALVVERANQTYHQIVGRLDGLVGRPWLDALPEMRGQGFDGMLLRVMNTGEATIGTESFARLARGPGGAIEDAWFNFVFQAVGSDGAGERGVLVLCNEVTGAVLARRDVERLVDELEERSAFERLLIGVVSHDLRNPLQAIHLAGAALASLGLDGVAARVTTRIQAATGRATALVSDLLDFTQARVGGGIPIAPRTIDLHQLTAETVDEVTAARPGRTVVVRHAGDGQGTWDPFRLAQVVENLVVNAIKYSPDGFDVDVETRCDDSGCVVRVKNGGAPIAATHLPALFEPLQRATPDDENAARSVGLGLYIVKHIVTAHGGTVDVESAVDAGTTFTVRLPRHSPVRASRA